MAAYFRNVADVCPACGKQALFRVFNTYNSDMGTFCETHAKERVARLNEIS